MSCPSEDAVMPTGMIDCSTAAAMLWDYLDGNLEDVKYDQVQQHLDRCAHCFPNAEFGQVVLKAVAQARQAAPAGPSLRDSVINRLRAAGYEGP